MNASTAKAAILPALGTQIEGGFFVAQFRLVDATYGLVVSPTAGDVDEVSWQDQSTDVPGARSFIDGRANTQAMAVAGSSVAKTILALSLGGFSDWYLPSRDELELGYRYLKPTTETNYAWRSGENPSALPPTFPYTEDSPLQTSAMGFQENGQLALQAAAYWASTQSSRNYAWSQDFDDGIQNFGSKSAKLRARAFRRFRIE